MSDDEDEFRDMGEEDRLVRYAQEGMRNEMENMLECENCDPNELNTNGESALIEALSYGHYDICEYLLDLPGIDPNVRDHDGDPFLFLLLNYNNTRRNDLTLKVINHPELDILATDELGNSSLSHICSYGINTSDLLVRALLLRGMTDGQDGSIYVNMTNNQGMAAIHYLANAPAPNSSEILRLLMDENVDLNIRDHMAPQLFRFHRTPLHLAIISANPNSVEVVRMLLNDPRVEVHVQDGTGKTPLLSIHSRIDREKLTLLLTNERINPRETDANNRGVFDLLLQPQMGGLRTPNLDRLIYMLMAVFLNEGYILPPSVAQNGYSNLIASSFIRLKDLPSFGRADTDRLLDIWDKPSDIAWSILYLHDYFKGYKNLHKWSPQYAKEISVMEHSFSVDLAIKGLQYMRKKQPKKREGEPMARLQNKRRKTKLAELIKQLKF